MDPAHLTVSRTSDRDLKIRGIEVLLDGESLGSLAFGRSLERDIEVGHHTLKVTNRLNSRPAEFDASPGETVKFETAGIAMGGLWLFMTMLGTVAFRVTLDRAG
jgi:plastocyanin